MARPLPNRDHLILEDHIRDGKSLRTIEAEHGLANGTLSRYARIKNLPVRTKGEQLLKNFRENGCETMKGEKHWAYGLTKETSAHYARRAVAMTLDNPTRRPGVTDKIVASNRAGGTYERIAASKRGTTLGQEQRQKIAQTLAPQFRQQLTKREEMVRQALIFDPRWISQHQIGSYLLDFARPDIRCAIEVDTGGHKAERAAKRDAWIVGQGWTILRTRYDTAKSPAYFARLLRIAEKLIPDFQCPEETPATSSHCYGVLIRCAEDPAGFEVNGPDDPLLALLAPNLRHRLVPTPMG